MAPAAAGRKPVAAVAVVCTAAVVVVLEWMVLAEVVAVVTCISLQVR